MIAVAFRRRRHANQDLALHCCALERNIDRVAAWPCRSTLLFTDVASAIAIPEWDTKGVSEGNLSKYCERERCDSRHDGGCQDHGAQGNSQPKY